MVKHKECETSQLPPPSWRVGATTPIDCEEIHVTVVDADGKTSTRFETRLLNLENAYALHHGIPVDVAQRILNGETVVVG